MPSTVVNLLAKSFVKNVFFAKTMEKPERSDNTTLRRLGIFPLPCSCWSKMNKGVSFWWHSVDCKNVKREPSVRSRWLIKIKKKLKFEHTIWFQVTQVVFLDTGTTAKNWNIFDQMERFCKPTQLLRRFTGILDSSVRIVSLLSKLFLSVYSIVTVFKSF